MPKFVTQGTPTTTGGVVLEGHSTILIDGKPATSVNQKATCASGRKSCKKIGIIVPVGGNDAAFLPNGLQAALTGYQVLCNCPDNFIQDPSNSVNVGFGSDGINFGGNVNMGANVNINLGNGVSIGSNTSMPNTENVVSDVIHELGKEFNEHFVLRDKLTSKNASEFAYKINTNSGSVEGITESGGKTKLISGDKEDLAELEYVFQTKVGIE
ncbi:TPA: PAAR domain-containing protein [Photobacterium damselae]|uniref:PAAR domain-containing protein n=1 Tax=Photobacterium damselae TaxID=38293 RepID=UPI0025434747